MRTPGRFVWLSWLLTSVLGFALGLGALQLSREFTDLYGPLSRGNVLGLAFFYLGQGLLYGVGLLTVIAIVVGLSRFVPGDAYAFLYPDHVKDDVDDDANGPSA